MKFRKTDSYVNFTVIIRKTSSEYKSILAQLPLLNNNKKAYNYYLIIFLNDIKYKMIDSLNP